MPRESDASNGVFAASAKVPWWRVFLGLLIALLIADAAGGVVNHYAGFNVPIGGIGPLQAALNRLVPFDAARGEGVTVQGAVLIVLLALIGVSAWFGLNKVDEGYNRWTWVALALIALTLVLAAVRMIPGAESLRIQLTGKMFAVVLAMAGIWLAARRYFDEYQLQEWLWETWRFVKQIFPLLIVGVFAVGVIRVFIKPEWIEALAGSNTVLANLVGVLFGVFMYFPTLVEVPIANMFLGLGMHRGPLLAYLMADPELSLQSILITAGIIGRLKAWTYVAWVALFSTLAGLLYGAWVDGASPWLILLALVAGIAILTLALRWVGARQAKQSAT